MANDFDQYQTEAMRFSRAPEMPPGVYPTLGLCGEVGEVAGKVKKYYRDGGNRAAFVNAVRAEMGDVLWYLARLGVELKTNLSEVASGNLVKLQDRADRNVLSGSGDNR